MLQIEHLAKDLPTTLNNMLSKLEEGNKKVEDSLVDIEKMASQMTEIKDKIDEVFSDIDKQSEFTSDFAKQVSNISDSYEELRTGSEYLR